VEYALPQHRKANASLDSDVKRICSVGKLADGLPEFTTTITNHETRKMSTLNITIRPEYFRLPSKGVDPYFGLSRSYYYELDSTGQVLLVRLRNRGSQRGVVLVNYDAMSAFIAKAANRTDGDATETPAGTKHPPTPAAGNAHRLVQRYPEDVELMRKLTPSLLHDLFRTVFDLEELVQTAAHTC
jgi:hypothetical protein